MVRAEQGKRREEEKKREEDMREVRVARKAPLKGHRDSGDLPRKMRHMKINNRKGGGEREGKRKEI